MLSEGWYFVGRKRPATENSLALATIVHVSYAGLSVPRGSQHQKRCSCATRRSTTCCEAPMHRHDMIETVGRLGLNGMSGPSTTRSQGSCSATGR